MTTVEAIYEDGVLKPVQDLNLPERQRVRLSFETVEAPGDGNRSDARKRLIERLQRSRLAFGGQLPTREELHDRHD